MTNELIRLRVMQSGLRFWQIAQELGISAETLSRKLRRQMSVEETEKVLEAIDRLSKAQ